VKNWFNHAICNTSDITMLC